MRTYDHGFESSKGKVRRKKKGSNLEKLQRHVASMSKEQISRLIADAGKTYTKGEDATGDMIFENTKRHEREQVQAKLAISQPEDQSEKQADKVAEGVTKGDVGISKMALEQTPSDINAKSDDAGMTTTPGFDQELQGTKGQGSKLDDSVKSEMEGHLGTDLSGVNIHTSGEAQKMSGDINAKAFTHGQDVYFNEGQYNPSSQEGKGLLAHELTHTVQQKGSEIQPKIMKKDDPEIAKLKYVLELPLFSFKVPGGEMEVKLSLEGESEKEKGKEPSADNKGKWSTLETEIKASGSVKEGIQTSIGTSLVGFASQDIPLFQGSNIQVSFDFKALNFEMEKEKPDFSLLEATGTISGEISTLEQLAQTPFNTATAQALIKAGFKFKFGGSLTYKLNDAKELARLVQMKRMEKMLKDKTDEIEREAKKLKKFKKSKREIIEEEFKKYKQKKKLPPETRLKKLSYKQQQEFNKRLNKLPGYKTLKKEIKALEKRVKILGKQAKRLLKGITGIAKKMISPLGKLAAKIGFKSVLKVLARLNLIADIVMLIADLIVLIRFYEHIGMDGETPNPWDDVPEETPEDVTEEGDTDKKANNENGKKENGKEPGEVDIEKDIDDFEKEFESDSTGTKKDKDDDDDDDDTLEESVGKGKVSPDENVSREAVQIIMENGDNAQKAIFKQLTDTGQGITLTKEFAEEFMALPLAGLEEDKLKRFLEIMQSGSGKSAKSTEEVLSILQEIIDKIDVADITKMQEGKKGKETEKMEKDIGENNQIEVEIDNPEKKKNPKKNDIDNKGKGNLIKNLGDTPQGKTEGINLVGYVLQGVPPKYKEGDRLTVTLNVFYIDDKNHNQTYYTITQVKLQVTDISPNKVKFKLVEEFSVNPDGEKKHYYRLNFVLSVDKNNIH